MGGDAAKAARFPPADAGMQMYLTAPCTMQGCWAKSSTAGALSLQGFVCVAFVIDVLARRIAGWKASSSARTDFVLDALTQALPGRRRSDDDALIHHSGCGVRVDPLHRAAGRRRHRSVGG